MKNKFYFKGEVSYKIIDLPTGDIIKESGGHNLVVDVGKNALISSMAGGSQSIINTVKVGTGTTTFTSTDTDLYNVVATNSGEVATSVNNVLTVRALFTFDSSYQLEEAGVFFNSTAWGLSNEISEAVTPTQGFDITWTITLITCP